MTAEPRLPMTGIDAALQQTTAPNVWSREGEL
jgi:hypothetical protein